MTRTITLEVAVSDWANYVATDMDGDVFEYSHEQTAIGSSWSDPSDNRDSTFRFLGTVDPPADWTKTLRRITEDGRLEEV